MPERPPFVVIELDPSMTVVGWNDRAERLFGVPRHAALGRPIAELLPVDGGDATWRAALARTDDEPQIVVVDHSTGERHLEVWIEATGDQAIATRVYAHDVTARVAGQRRHALESALLSALKSNLDVATWAIDRQGTVLIQQGKALAAIGMTDDQLVGMNLMELYRESPDFPLIEGALAGRPGHSAPGVNNEQHGLQWENWFLPVADPASGAAVIGISLHVTEARRREEELRARIELIEEQREVIRELSTPIIEVWDGVLTLPIVGLVDSARTAELMDDLLQAVTRTRSRFAILDLTGVQVVDTSTASHLIGLVQAIRLLGAEGVLSGIHPNIAQTIVAIGVDLSRVRVFATLRDALEDCIERTTRRG
jgi:rsbT co-antagonist protein RsbR